MLGERNQVSKELFKGFYAMNASLLKHFLTEMFCQILVGVFQCFFNDIESEGGFLDLSWLKK